MKLYRNLTSGHLFISSSDYDAENAHLWLITPEGKIKRLEQHLFEPIDGHTASERDLFVHLSEAQIEKYQKVTGRSIKASN